MNRLRITRLNYLLSSFVMAWGILPPALIHSHEGGGDTDHRHASRTVAVESAEDHGHVHDAESAEHGDYSQKSNQATLLGSLVAHLHWDFLGVDLSIPVPAEDGGRDRAGEQEQVLIRLTDELPMLAGASDSLAVSHMPLLQARLDCVSAEESPSRPVGVIASIPLCDSARFERSGVLLS